MTGRQIPFGLLFGSLFLLFSCSSPAQLEQPTAAPIKAGPSPEAGSSQPWPVKDMTVRPQIWFGPLDPIDWTADVPGGSGYNFFSLFTEGAPWIRAANATRVVVLYPIWLSSAGTSQIQRVVDDLRRRRIAIAYEAGPLSEFGRCNAGTIEGFAGPDPNRQIAQNIKSAGGVLFTWSMEHGFDAATYYDPACRMTPEQIAEDAARSVAAVRSVFPDVQIGSIETGNLNVDEIASWLSAYREATGEELAYLHLDVPTYIPDWAERAKQIEDYVRSRGIDFGIFYTGDPDDSSDEEWVAKAEQHFVEYEVVAGGRPDHAIFQSWNPHPVSLLPEDQPATFTWLITRYLRPRTEITLDIDQGVASGFLTKADGSPLAGMEVQISGLPLAGEGAFANYSLTGIVPEGATHANIGLHINNECDCSGPAEMIFGSASYQEQGTVLIPNGSFGNGSNGWGIWGAGLSELMQGENGRMALHIAATPRQDVGLNSDSFTVTPGQPFTATFRARVDPPTEGSGYFAIFFLNQSGEVKRYTLPVSIVSVPLGTAQTDADGKYSLKLDGLAGIWNVRAWYDGGDDLWPAMADLEFIP